MKLNRCNTQRSLDGDVYLYLTYPPCCHTLTNSYLMVISYSTSMCKRCTYLERIRCKDYGLMKISYKLLRIFHSLIFDYLFLFFFHIDFKISELELKVISVNVHLVGKIRGS